jgi:hypothetical protein
MLYCLDEVANDVADWAHLQPISLEGALGQRTTVYLDAQARLMTDSQTTYSVTPGGSLEPADLRTLGEH